MLKFLFRPNDKAKTKTKTKAKAKSYLATSYDDVNNAGGGDCGYYALMMGMIHLAKSPDTAERMRTKILKWKALDPDSVADIDSALSEEMNILDRELNKELFYRLQRSLRIILFKQISESIPERVELLVDNGAYAYDQFKFLLEYVRPATYCSRADVLANPLCASTSEKVKNLAFAINAQINLINYPGNPMVQSLAHEAFFAASFIKFRNLIIEAYQNYYVGKDLNHSHSWATDKCLLKLTEENALDIPLQFFIQGRPAHEPVMPLNEMGIRLNNHGNQHWTLFIPKTGIMEAEHDASVQQLVVQQPPSLKKNQMIAERGKLKDDMRSYLLTMEPQLTDYLIALDQQSDQEHNDEEYTSLKQQYSDLIALHGAHRSLSLYLAQHGEVQDRLTYDETMLRLEIQRNQLKFNNNTISAEERTQQMQQIENQKDEMKREMIQRVSANEQFQQLLNTLEPKKPVSQKPAPMSESSTNQRKSYRRREMKGEQQKPFGRHTPKTSSKRIRKRASSAYPGYALNACIGGLVIGAAVVGSAPNLLIATAGLLSVSSVGAILLLLAASMFLAVILTVLTLYVMEICKSPVAPAPQIR